MADTNVQERLYRLVVDGSQALNQLKKISKSTESIDQRFSKMASSFRNIFAVFAAGGAVASIVNMAQKLNALSASLNTLTGSAAKGAEALALVYNIVNKTGVSLDVAGASFQRLSIGLKSLGASNQQIAAIAENFIKLGRVGGSSIEETKNALLQFSQAISSGVLQGDEFKSIFEQMPLFMTQLADSIGVSVGELKKMGADGKLTSDIIANSLLKNTEALDKAFASLPITFEQGMNKIQAAVARLSQVWFNQSEMGTIIGRAMVIVAEEIDKITEKSKEWSGVMNELKSFFLAISEDVIILTGNIKALGLGMRFLAEAPKAFGEGGFAGLGALSDELDSIQIDIENAAGAQWRYLHGTQNELDKLAGSVENYAFSLDKLKGKPPIVSEADLKKAAAAMQKLQSEWQSFFDKVKTPDETFNELSKQLDVLVAKLHPAADAVARVRAELEKTRNEANEKIRVEGLTEYAKGWEGAQDAIKKTFDDAEQLRGQLELLAKLGPPNEWNAGALALATSLGKSATAAAQLEVAIRSVNSEAENIAALKVEFDKLSDSGQYTTEQLAKIKDALGGLGEKKSMLDEMGVAIGQTLANGVDGFVDALTSSEGDINAWFANLLAQIGKLLIQMALLQAAKAALGGTAFGSFFGLSQGAALPGGTGLPYGVYNNPTFFKFAKGATFGSRNGVLGEAGPEAVVPLKRTADGDLGVQASPINMTINNYTDAEVKVTETNKSDGTKDIEVTILRTVRAAMSDGSMDRTMRDNYNVSRAGR